MTKQVLLKPQLIAFLIPTILLLSLVLLINSSLSTEHQGKLYTFISIDFIITIPLIYFLLIRKTKISNLTIAPFLIACVVIASYTIPMANQGVLNLAKIWLIPVIELTVLSFVILKVRKAIKVYKKAATPDKDFHTTLLETCKSIFPATAAKLVVNEIAIIYYGFFNFKTITLKDNEFSNYKGSGILSTLGALILVVGIEMITIHYLVSKWNLTFAWTLTGLSIYSALQLIGIIRSVPKRPIVINKDHLLFRFGILSETTVPLDAIENIKLIDSSDFNKEKGTKTLSLLGEMEHSNIMIHLKTPQHIESIYGKPKPYTKLLCFVDDNQRFKTEVKQLLSN